MYSTVHLFNQPLPSTNNSSSMFSILTTYNFDNGAFRFFLLEIYFSLILKPSFKCFVIIKLVTGFLHFKSHNLKNWDFISRNSDIVVLKREDEHEDEEDAGGGEEMPYVVVVEDTQLAGPIQRS